MLHSRIFLLATLALVASCSSSVEPVTQTGLRVINASRAPVDVVVDGQVVLQGLRAADVSSSLMTSTGAHVLQLRPASGSAAELSVQTTAGQTLTTVVYQSGTALSANVLADTGSIVPSGKSKLRVAQLSANAGAIELWRTQPDYQTPIHIMTPFVYQATSPYLQSDPGTWEVFATPAGSTTKLATTGAVNVPSGERRTVVLLDSAGVLRFRVIAE